MPGAGIACRPRARGDQAPSPFREVDPARQDGDDGKGTGVTDIVFDGWRPGAIAQTLALHMEYYAPAWGFGLRFESKLAAEMGEFHGRFEPARDLFLGAWAPDGALLATISVDGIDARGEGAHLRWFVAAARARGHGLGGTLMRRVDAFLDDRGYARAYLTTFAGLDAARALYDRHGYARVAEEKADPWSGTVGLQRLERRR